MCVPFFTISLTLEDRAYWSQSADIWNSYSLLLNDFTSSGTDWGYLWMGGYKGHKVCDCSFISGNDPENSVVHGPLWTSSLRHCWKVWYLYIPTVLQRASLKKNSRPGLSNAPFTSGGVIIFHHLFPHSWNSQGWLYNIMRITNKFWKQHIGTPL